MSLRRRKLSGDQRAFTLIEVLIIAPILMVTVVSLLAFLFNMYGQFIQKNEEAGMQVEAQAAIFTFKDDLISATGFNSSTAVDSNVSDPYKSTGWVAYTSSGGQQLYNGYPLLIISAPTYTASRRSASRTKVYNANSNNASTCPPAVTQAYMEANYAPNKNNFVYFVENGTLYRRTLTQSNVTCGTPYFLRTCPAANVTPTCPPDKVIAKNLSALSYTYYRPGNVQTNVPEQAERVTINFTMTQTIAGDPISANGSISLKRLGE